MTVEHILHARRAATSSRSSPNSTLGEAARLLSERKIGAVVVSDAFRPVLGILSERDIVRAVAQRGAVGARGAGRPVHDREGRSPARAVRASTS